MKAALPAARLPGVAAGTLIRLARPGDAAAIGAIYDEGVASGIATFAQGRHDAAERRAWLAARPAHAPVFVGLDPDRVVAWSALAPLSQREWYAGVAEYTAYVAAGAQGSGVGGRMLDHLIGTAAEFGYWKLVGLILPENVAGLRLAASRGFRTVGVHRGHAERGGRWLDVTVVERHIAAPAIDQQG